MSEIHFCDIQKKSSGDLKKRLTQAGSDVFFRGSPAIRF